VRVLLIDNFDSFVYNLAQAFGSLGAEVVVARNDADLSELEALSPDAVVVSPGPGGPEDAGVSVQAVLAFGPLIPVLGVCLGHQCIGSAFGGRIERAEVGPVHGKTSPVTHSGAGIFTALPSPFRATRYHSLSIQEEAWPSSLEVTARSDDGTIMGIRHRTLPIEGVQFHPESVLCEDGPKLLENFLVGAASGIRSDEERHGVAL
jgi:anthranilate synthase/aminodeoxychorismate synthase-like glutamine amidotransferase